MESKKKRHLIRMIVAFVIGILIGVVMIHVDIGNTTTIAIATTLPALVSMSIMWWEEEAKK